ncbi:MAG: arginine--tRNA ligase [Hahellaceae bacterium]|nr:arginine--tRNA ligase [Hahellaceae bacterium]
MKQSVEERLRQALDDLISAGKLPESVASLTIQVEETRDKQHGDFASNLAMILTKQAGMPPRQVAQALTEAMKPDPAIEKVEIAGPGFINFFLSNARFFEVIEEVMQKGTHYGESNLGQGQRVQVEFVSANPTGPLHVGHGRGAAYGDSLSRLLKLTGHDVHKEYYVNDAGRQMNILAASVWLRYLELSGESFTFPSNGYKGTYVNEISEALKQRVNRKYFVTASDVFRDIPADEPAGGDKEAHIDALVNRCRSLLGPEGYLDVFDAGLNSILDDIRDDLESFGITYHEWFSEKSLAPRIQSALTVLKDNGHLYEQDGATWFRSTTFGDDKDRVVIRENGEFTYFASDIAYHHDKFQRGFDRVINIWGADHHGYIPRVKAALTALNLDAAKLDVKLVQFAILYRGETRVQMSTRSGSFVTLRELRDEVGNDAARFFYVTRKTEQHMDFDLDLAKSESKDNPVYYIQYAHARICSMLRKLQESEGRLPDAVDPASYARQLTDEAEKTICAMLARYPEVINTAAGNLEPHQITHYLKELAGIFHSYYNSQKVLVEDASLRTARVRLSLATRQVLANGLNLIGVTAPDVM